MKTILEKIKEYLKDKELAEKCGLDLQDICLHEWETVCFYGEFGKKTVRTQRCKKCGEHTSGFLR